MTIQSTDIRLDLQGEFYGHVLIGVAENCGQRPWQTIGQSDCNLSSEPWSCVIISPSLMLVQNYCVCEGQDSTFDEYVNLYLPGAWKKFRGTATNSIISVICLCSAILPQKIINNILSRQLNSVRDHMTLSIMTLRDNPSKDFRQGDAAQKP